MTTNEFLAVVKAELTVSARPYTLTDGAIRLLVDASTPDDRNRVLSLARHFGLSARPVLGSHRFGITAFRSSIDGLTE